MKGCERRNEILKKENEEAADSLQALLAEVWDLKTKNQHLTSMVKVSMRAGGRGGEEAFVPLRHAADQEGGAVDRRRANDDR
eukprot:767375-Hanusia_phi.AAC.1